MSGGKSARAVWASIRLHSATTVMTRMILFIAFLRGSTRNRVSRQCVPKRSLGPRNYRVLEKTRVFRAQALPGQALLARLRPRLAIQLHGKLLKAALRPTNLPSM